MIIRGIERTLIFRDDRDRDAFLDRLGGILLESSTPCYTWSLLGNHAHFLLRTREIPIALVMRKLLTGYAVTFNRRYGRHGHLFQNRYKSILCEEWERGSVLRERGVTLEGLVEKVAAHFGLKAEGVKPGSKIPVIVKAGPVGCYMGERKLGLTSVSTAKEQRISPSAVSKSIARAQHALWHEDIEEQFLESL